MILDLITTIAGGVFSGGATGLIGIAISKWAEHKKQQTDLALLKLNLDAARETRAMELAAQERMANSAQLSAERIEQMQAEARAAESADSLMQASYAHDRATYLAPGAQQHSRVALWLMALVDFSRGMIRPGMTVYTTVLLTMLMLWVRELYGRAGMAMSAAEIKDLSMQVVGTITYLSTTTTVWWFGVRPSKR